MTVRPSPDDDRSSAARPGAEPETREPAGSASVQARAGSPEGAPAAPAVDERGWWEKQLGVPLEAA